VNSDPTGGSVYDAALCLCWWLESESGRAMVPLVGRAVVELGAGTGIVGLAAGRLGAHRVWMTDGTSLLLCCSAALLLCCSAALLLCCSALRCFAALLLCFALLFCSALCSLLRLVETGFLQRVSSSIDPSNLRWKSKRKRREPENDCEPDRGIGKRTGEPPAVAMCQANLAIEAVRGNHRLGRHLAITDDHLPRQAKVR
jgi:hypothetical protein